MGRPSLLGRRHARLATVVIVVVITGGDAARAAAQRGRRVARCGAAALGRRPHADLGAFVARDARASPSELKIPSGCFGFDIERIIFTVDRTTVDERTMAVPCISASICGSCSLPHCFARLRMARDGSVVLRASTRMVKATP